MSNNKNTEDNSVQHLAEVILKNYDYLIKTYLNITSIGKRYFEKKLFSELFSNAQKRYRLYGNVVKDTLQEIEYIMKEDLSNREKWRCLKNEYSLLIKNREDRTISETFFNSITRKVFQTESFDPNIEFLDFDDHMEIEHTEPKVYETIKAGYFNTELIEKILNYFQFKVPYIDIKNDAKLIFEEMVQSIIFQKGNLQIDRVEFLKEAFYRNRGAFLVGVIRHKSWSMPFVIPILHGDNGLYVDTVVYNRNEVSIIFSFTRASFFVYTQKPVELTSFLKNIIPHKSVGELYDSIGYYKHGKTTLYRELYNYIHNHDDEFIIAPGIKGMVMCVFTLKYFNFVFKIIRDSFDNPKNITREQVIKKYEQVELNDRVGRMAYAHLFENLEFDRKLFTSELIEELQRIAKNTVTFTEDKVFIKHVYLERRMTPLNIYLESASLIEKCQVVLDYGYAVKELAVANIFPGDLLQKNFGVTRHGRVIFYDYDEICKVTECKFRRIPPVRHHFDEFGDEPHFSAGPDDVFPEEFKNFMAPQGALRELFMTEHGDLFEPKYWINIQERIKNHELVEFYAYPINKRFKQTYST